MKILTTLLAFLILAPAVPNAVAQDAPDGAWSGVTVLLADGWRYRDVTVYLDPHGAGLWVQRPDGAERLVPSEKVTRIVGSGGTDVTAVVLAGGRDPRVAPPPASASPRGSTVPESRAEAWDGTSGPAATSSPPESATRPFGMAFSLEGGYGFPMGDHLDSFQPSWTAGARLRIGTTNNSYLGVGYRYQDLPTTTDFGEGLSAHLAIYEGTFGWMSAALGKRPRSYFELGAALMEEVVTFDYEDFSSRYTDNRGAFVFRAGVLVPLGTGFGIDLGTSWTYSGLLFTDEYESDGSVVAVHLGLTWMN